MASGIINLTSNDSRLEGRIVWSSSTNGSSANTSNVYAELQARRTDSYTTKGTWSGSLFIHDEQQDYSNASTSVSSNWVTMKSFTKYNVPHNDNGTGWCHIWGNVSAPSGTSMAGAYAEVDTWVELDTIPRYLTITSFKVQTKTINTAVINWFTSDSRNSTYYSLNGGAWISSATYGESVASDQKSGTFNIKNLSPNTTYKLKIKCTRSDSGLETVSSEISFTTYDYAKLSSVPNVNIGSAHTITWTNPSGATTSLKLCKTDNSSIIDYGTVTGTSKSLTPTAATIYALTPNSNTYKARYILTTTQNSKTYTNYKDFTFTVTNSNPTFTNYTYQDTNATTVALTGDNQILIKGYSNLKATVSTDNKAIAKNSATMKSYKLVSGSKSTSANYSSTADISLSVNNVDSGTIVLYATDSRGNSTPVAKTVTYKEYADLVIKSVTAERGSNGVGQGVTLKFSGTYWNDSFGNVTNTITNAKYYYRETSASDWIEGETELTFTTENGQFSGDVSIKGDLGANGFDVSKSFYIRLQVSDKLVTKTYDITLGSGTPAIAIYKNKVAIGEKYDTSKGGTLQVHGNLQVTGKSGNVWMKGSLDVSNKSFLRGGLYSYEVGNAENPIGNGTLIIKRVNNTEAPNNGVVLEYGNSKTWTGQLYIGDSAEQGIYYNGWSGGVRGDWRRLADVPVVLYSNDSGTDGSFTLSDSAENYSRFEIYFRDQEGQHSGMVVYNPNGKRINLDMTVTNSGVVGSWAKIKAITISETNVNVDWYCEASITDSVVQKNNYIYITKVIGFLN